ASIRWARRTANGRSRASRASGSRWGRRMFRRGIPATTGHPPGLEPRPRIPLPAVGLILAFAVLLGMLLYYAQFSGAIRWLLGDDALVDFLYLEAGDLDDRFAWVQRARARGSFDREFRDVLARMEAWR